MRLASESRCLQRSSKQLLRFGLLILLIASSTAAERPSGVRGRVVYELDGQPLRDVYVLAYLIGGKGEQQSIAHTDSTGHYELPLAPGVYDVMISSVFANPTCRKIEVSPDGMMVYNAKLTVSLIGMNVD